MMGLINTRLYWQLVFIVILIDPCHHSLLLAMAAILLIRLIDSHSILVIPR